MFLISKTNYQYRNGDMEKLLICVHFPLDYVLQIFIALSQCTQVSLPFTALLLTDTFSLLSLRVLI